MLKVAVVTGAELVLLLSSDNIQEGNTHSSPRIVNLSKPALSHRKPSDAVTPGVLRDSLKGSLNHWLMNAREYLYMH